MRAYPNGLTIVAGNSHAGTPQSRRIVFWDCGVVKTTLYGPMQPRLAAGRHAARRVDARRRAARPPSKLQLHVNFPDCWNGKTADSVDHKRHMAYSRRRPLPAEPPGRGAALSLVYQYPPLVRHGRRSRRAGIYSAHADFLNAWDEHALRGSRRPLPERGQAVRHRRARRLTYFGRRPAIAAARPDSNAAAGGVITDVTISTVSVGPPPCRITSR